MSSSIFSTHNAALITGAAMGIGRAAAVACAQAGMRVAAIDLPGPDLDSLDQELKALAESPEHILCIGSDLSVQGSVAHIFARVTEQLGSVNLLMNNAVSREGRTFDGSTDEWRRLFDVNLWALVEASRLFMPEMIKNGQRAAIVNVGSKQGITNPPGTPAYNMSKAAVKSFTEQLEHALRNDDNNHGHVTSHLLVPGWTTTGKSEHKQGAWLPHQVVEYMMAAIDRGSFYIICPDDEVSNDMDNRRIIWGAEDITEDRPPLSRWHAGFREAADKACS
jgi:NAD(P)-dependent dehydrogenase (short-subunit alcohol dehydrogenase family)